MLAATLASASATARRSPWWSARAAWIVTSSSPPPTPMTKTEPTVTPAVRPAVSPAAPRAITPAAARKARAVQPAGRVAQVQLVTQMGDHEARSRLQVGEPGEQRVGHPREPV